MSIKKHNKLRRFWFNVLKTIILLSFSTVFKVRTQPRLLYRIYVTLFNLLYFPKNRKIPNEGDS